MDATPRGATFFCTGVLRVQRMMDGEMIQHSQMLSELQDDSLARRHPKMVRLVHSCAYYLRSSGFDAPHSNRVSQ
jgi:hypothetical protein